MIIQIRTDVDESRVLWKRKESNEWKKADIDDLIRVYENKPKAKEGKWIWKSDKDHSAPAWTCSECGLRKVFKYNFCPNCGVDMRDKGISNEELESILNEIKEILTFYSFDLPMVYGDGEETVEKAVLLEEVDYAIQSIKDMKGEDNDS